MSAEHPTQVVPTYPGPAVPSGRTSGAPASLPGHGAGEPGVSPGLRVAAILVALLAAAGTYMVWKFFVATRTGQLIEEFAYDGALTGRTKLWALAEPVLGVVSVTSMVVGAVTIAGIALLRRRWALAVQAVVVIVGANLTTQLLKKVVFDRPALGDEGWWGNSLPSGHTTVAASVSVALLLAVPRAARPVMAVVGAAYTGATGISTLVGQWHRPSDVVAALLVTLVWGALACAFVTESAQDDSRGRPRSRFAPRGSGTAWVTALLGAVAAVAVALAGWALWETSAVAQGHRDVAANTDVLAYVGGAAGVVASTAFTFGVLLVFRQAVARQRLASPG